MKIPSWYNSLKTKKNALIIHHWDADGISSAALIIDFLKINFWEGIYNAIPEIGTYRIVHKENYKFIEKNITIRPLEYDVCFILDYSVPKEDIINLKASLNCPIIVYDHHLRDPVNEENIHYYNPIASGDKGSNWPSCTMVIMKHLELGMNNLVILGIAGDLEGRFLKGGLERFPEVKNYLANIKAEYTDFVLAKDLIDIHYKTNNRDILEILPWEVLKLKGEPEDILSKHEWSEKQKEHDRELKGYLAETPDDTLNKVMEIYNINTKNNIISTLTRRLAEKSEFNFVMVVNKGLFEKKSQIYIRCTSFPWKKNIALFKELAASSGAEVGGKEEVAGIIIDNAKIEDFLLKVRQTVYE